MSTELGSWLRRQREARGLTRPEMARRLIQAGLAKGDNMPGVESMCHNIYRWERGADGLSERYKLCYCQIFSIEASHFGSAQAAPLTAQAPGAFAVTAVPEVSAAPSAINGTVSPLGSADPYALLKAALAYRGVQQRDPGSSMIEREVLMAAHEGSEYAGHAEERGTGDITLEQFRADVTRLSLEFQTADPLPLFLEMGRVRGRMHDALDRRTWPRDATELYLLLGSVNHLMGLAAYDLGYPQAAEELLRAGWVYAIAIDHRPLMALLRLGFASILAAQQPQRCRQQADDGLRYVSAGPNAGALYLYQARAAARLGDASLARQAITDASEARERDHHDEILDLGGEFVISRATHHCYAGWALLEIPDAAAEAAAELELATELYMRGPEPGEAHGLGVEALARVNLATARLRSGALEAAMDALGPVLSLPVEHRILDLPLQLAAVRAEIAAPVFRSSAQARTLDEQIEEFGRETAAAGLHSLPGGPG
jgi:hypothetical protein